MILLRLGKYRQYLRRLVTICEPEASRLVSKYEVHRRLPWKRLKCHPRYESTFKSEERTVHIGVSNIIECVKSDSDLFQILCQAFPAVREMPTKNKIGWFFAFSVYHETGHAIQESRGEIDKVVETRKRRDLELDQDWQRLQREGCSVLDLTDFLTKLFKREQELDPVEVETERWASQYALVKLREAQEANLIESL